MATSTTPGTDGLVRADLIKALSDFQGRVDNVAKNAENPHFKSKYADLGAVLAVVRPHLCACGLAVTQITAIDGDDIITLVTTLWHTSGQCIESRYPVWPMKHDPQGLGAAMTYARRYSLAALLGVAQEDDDGNHAVRSADRQRRRERPETAAVKPWSGEVDFTRKVTRGEKKGRTWASITDMDWLILVAEHPDATDEEKAHAGARFDEMLAAQTAQAARDEYAPSELPPKKVSEIVADAEARQNAAKEAADKATAEAADRATAIENRKRGGAYAPPAQAKSAEDKPKCYMHHPPVDACPKGGKKPFTDPKECAKCPWDTACAEHSATVVNLVEAGK